MVVGGSKQISGRRELRGAIQELKAKTVRLIFFPGVPVEDSQGYNTPISMVYVLLLFALAPADPDRSHKSNARSGLQVRKCLDSFPTWSSPC